MQLLRRGAVEDFEDDHGNVALRPLLIGVYTAHSLATHAGTLESHRPRSRCTGPPAGPAGLRARGRPHRGGRRPRPSSRSPGDDTGLVVVGGIDGRGVELVRRARGWLAGRGIDAPLVFAGRACRAARCGRGRGRRGGAPPGVSARCRDDRPAADRPAGRPARPPRRQAWSRPPGCSRWSARCPRSGRSAALT